MSDRTPAPPFFSPQELTALGIPREHAGPLAARLNHAARLAPEDAWREISRAILDGSVPFPIHAHVHRMLFKNWPLEAGPPPAWTPTKAEIASTNMATLIRRRGFSSYEQLQCWSAAHPGAYWAEAIDDLQIAFAARPDTVLEPGADPWRPGWLAGAELNIAASCLNGAPESAAVIFGSEDGAIRRMTRGDLDVLSNRVAHGLTTLGIRRGEAVAIISPMTIEAIAGYLGIIKAGCVAVAIPESFAPPEIATRLRISSTRAVLCQNATRRAGKLIPLYESIKSADAPPAVVITPPAAPQPLLRAGDIAWEHFLSENGAFCPVSCAPGTPMTILFSSGTTGEPKAVPWTHLTPVKCAADARYHHDVKQGEVIAWPTSMGWMMGPWLLFAALINRAAVAVFDGGPNTRSFGTFIQDARVNLLGLVPSLVRAWRNAGTMEGLRWDSVRRFSSTGEASNAEDMLYCMSLAGYRPVIEYCGGTEIGGGYLTGTLTKPCVPGAFNAIALGIGTVIRDEAGHPCSNGELFIIPPSIGLSEDLLNTSHREIYDAGATPDGTPLRRHGDHVEALAGGYYRIRGRMDDTMNLGGIKVGSAEIEEALRAVDEFKECAAVGLEDPGGGPLRLTIFAVRTPESRSSHAELLASARNAIRQRLNPLFKIHELCLIQALPRTPSQKIIRRALRGMLVATDRIPEG